METLPVYLTNPGPSLIEVSDSNWPIFAFSVKKQNKEINILYITIFSVHSSISELEAVRILILEAEKLIMTDNGQSC